MISTLRRGLLVLLAALPLMANAAAGGSAHDLGVNPLTRLPPGNAVHQPPRNQLLTRANSKSEYPPTHTKTPISRTPEAAHREFQTT